MSDYGDEDWEDEPSDWEDDGDDDFDYEQYIADHHSDHILSTSLSPIWRWTAIVLLVLMVMGYLFLAQ